MTCPSCGKQLVEVDNPIRREVRHRRGEERQCPAWRAAAGLPPTSAASSVEFWQPHRGPHGEIAYRYWAFLPKAS